MIDDSENANGNFCPNIIIIVICCANSLQSTLLYISKS